MDVRQPRRAGGDRGLGTREVWFWQKGGIAGHARRGDGHERSARSEVLAGSDLMPAAAFVEAPSRSRAVRALREVLARR